MEYKKGNVTYDFEEMIVYTPQGWSKLIVFNNQLFRMGQKKRMEVGPKVNEAYFEYVIEKMLLDGE